MNNFLAWLRTTESRELLLISFQTVFCTLQISIGWLSVISSVIHLALKVILPIRIIPIGKILYR